MEQGGRRTPSSGTWSTSDRREGTIAGAARPTSSARRSRRSWSTFPTACCRSSASGGTNRSNGRTSPASGGTLGRRDRSGASPIQHWTALHVWIYIFMSEGTVQPLVRAGTGPHRLLPLPGLGPGGAGTGQGGVRPFEGMGRLPAQSTPRSKRLGPRNGWSMGLWRWKTRPAVGQGGAGTHRIIIPARDGTGRKWKRPVEGNLTLRMQDGFSPCIARVQHRGGVLPEPGPGAGRQRAEHGR